MERGKIVYELPPLEEIRRRALENLAKLPEKYKRLKRAAKYPVRLSPRLRKLIRELSMKLLETEGSFAVSSWQP
jgi:nicotinate phosphoribosyltransferase